MESQSHSLSTFTFASSRSLASAVSHCGNAMVLLLVSLSASPIHPLIYCSSAGPSAASGQMLNAITDNLLSLFLLSLTIICCRVYFPNLPYPLPRPLFAFLTTRRSSLSFPIRLRSVVRRAVSSPAAAAAAAVSLRPSPLEPSSAVPLSRSFTGSRSQSSSGGKKSSSSRSPSPRSQRFSHFARRNPFSSNPTSPFTFSSTSAYFTPPQPATNLGALNSTTTSLLPAPTAMFHFLQFLGLPRHPAVSHLLSGPARRPHAERQPPLLHQPAAVPAGRRAHRRHTGRLVWSVPEAGAASRVYTVAVPAA